MQRQCPHLGASVAVLALLASISCAGAPPAPFATPPPKRAYARPVASFHPAPPLLLLPGDAPAERGRRSNAVLLLGVEGLAGDAGPRFLPILCVLGGKLAAGIVCGEAMPPRARVRTTRAQPDMLASLALSRSTRGYRDEAGDHSYVAPHGPECCMYNTCNGKTIPYFADANAQLPTRRVLAVWPEDAEIWPRPLERVAALEGPWNGRLDQSVVTGNQRLASVSAPPCASCASLWSDQGSGWNAVQGLGPGADGYDILATTDMDGDGKAEAIVFERWRNDYGLLVLGNDWTRPAYRFSCGNI